MATNPGTPDSKTSPPRPPTATETGMSRNRPLQVFLLGALIIAGLAYLRNQWAYEDYDEGPGAHRVQLRRLVRKQNIYLNHLSLGIKAENGNHFDEAATEFQRALIAANTAQGHIHLANVLVKMQKFDEAFAEYKEALRLSPGSMEVYSNWGNALATQAKYDEAINILQEAVKANPKSAEGHYGLARVLEQEQAGEEAAHHSSEAAMRDNESEQHEAVAVNLGHQVDEQYATALKLGLNTPEFSFSYGKVLNKEGKYAEAEPYLHKAVEAKPTDAAAWHQLAVAQEHQGKYGEAIENYEKTLTLTPDDPQTLNNLAVIYATASDPEVRSPQMAILLGTRICTATSDQNARFMDTLARGYAAAGNFLDAISWEDKAIHRATQMRNRDELRDLNPRMMLFMQHKLQ